MESAGADDVDYMLVERQRSIERDTKQLECIFELHSAPGNVDATRDVQTRQTLLRSKDHCLGLTRIEQQSVLHKPCGYGVSAVCN